MITIPDTNTEPCGFWVTDSDSKMRFYYTLRIDNAGFETIRWLARHGYDCGLEEALERTDVDGVYAIAEHKAWEIHDACYDGSEDSEDERGGFIGFPSLNWHSPIGQEITRFLQSIV